MKDKFKSLEITKETKLDDFPVDYTKDFPKNPTEAFLSEFSKTLYRSVACGITQEFSYSFKEINQLAVIYKTLACYRRYIDEGFNYLLDHQAVRPLDEKIHDSFVYVLGCLDLLIDGFGNLVHDMSHYTQNYREYSPKRKAKSSIVNQLRNKPIIH